MDQADPFKEYRVVINMEEQYSIWPTCKDIPRGWNDVGGICSAGYRI